MSGLVGRIFCGNVGLELDPPSALGLPPSDFLSKATLQPFWSHSGLQGLIWTHFGPPGIDLKTFRLPRLDLELFKAPGLDFAAIWASSAWFGTICASSQGSI